MVLRTIWPSLDQRRSIWPLSHDCRRLRGSHVVLIAKTLRHPRMAIGKPMRPIHRRPRMGMRHGNLGLEY